MNYDIDFDFGDSDTMYLTHSLHPYPAKFPPQLPHTIIKQFAHKQAVVLDPFCGSGTTLVEARLLGCNAIGVDVNGLSSLLSKVKATPLSEKELLQIKLFLDLIANEDSQWKKRRPIINVKQIDGLEHWFQLNVAEELTHILNLIAKISDENVRDYLKIVLSSIIVRVSNQESDTRFAAKNKNIPNNFTFNLFLSRANEYLTRIADYSKKVNKDSYLKLLNADSRNLSMLGGNSIDIVITSPPYANTYEICNIISSDLSEHSSIFNPTFAQKNSAYIYNFQKAG
jgi:site-specific DNA-methyltransferase (cytosine-N4-specific)